MSLHEEIAAAFLALMKSRPNLEVTIHYSHNDRRCTGAAAVFVVVEYRGVCVTEHFPPDAKSEEFAAAILARLDRACSI